MQSSKISLVIHGGAGTMDRAKMTPEKERAYHDGLEAALKAGWEILQRDGGAVEAVEAAVRALEDNPLFNAGRGAVFTSAGVNELDASIMDGKTLKAGAVSNLQHVKNPITLARTVMEKSPHVMLVGAGAEAFAKESGLELVDPKYFFTQERWDALQRVKEGESAAAATGKRYIISDEDRHGTVGAAARDSAGNLAAATSTGGMTNKRPGRIGDSPIIGAGTYANNKTCAVSCTGDGEYFIRAAVAHTVSVLMEMRGMPLREAAEKALQDANDLGGTGGLIALDKDGNFALPFNTNGMYRGYMNADGKPVAEIYK